MYASHLKRALKEKYARRREERIIDALIESMSSALSITLALFVVVYFSFHYYLYATGVYLTK